VVVETASRKTPWTKVGEKKTDFLEIILKMTIEIVDLPIENGDLPIYTSYYRVFWCVMCPS
jgi:hypothetical protein